MDGIAHNQGEAPRLGLGRPTFGMTRDQGKRIEVSLALKNGGSIVAIDELDESLSADVLADYAKELTEGHRRGEAAHLHRRLGHRRPVHLGQPGRSRRVLAAPREVAAARQSARDGSARRPRRHAGEHDLIEAFGQPGCPVCRLSTEAVDAYLTSVCYEQVNDLDLREQLRSAGGFCRAHAERFIQQRLGQLAAAIVYRDVLNTARKRLGWPAGPGAAARCWRRCSAARTASVRTVPRLPRLRGRGRSRGPLPRASSATACATRPSASEYQAGDGLCLPHIDQALQTDDDGAVALAEAAVEMLGTIVGRPRRVHPEARLPLPEAVWDGGEDTPERAVERAVGHHPGPQFVPWCGPGARERRSA